MICDRRRCAPLVSSDVITSSHSEQFHSRDKQTNSKRVLSNVYLISHIVIFSKCDTCCYFYCYMLDYFYADGVIGDLLVCLRVIASSHALCFCFVSFRDSRVYSLGLSSRFGLSRFFRCSSVRGGSRGSVTRNAGSFLRRFIAHVHEPPE